MFFLKYQCKTQMVTNIFITAAVIWMITLYFTLYFIFNNLNEQSCETESNVCIKLKSLVNVGPVGVEDITKPGEMGKPVVLPANMSEELKLIVTKGWKTHYFNQYVSDIISANRTLPDLRDDWCKEPGRYWKDLPVTDVIICFHNEAWSTLLRTVHSVLNRSPAHLIGQIILVDDYSNSTHLQKPLHDYFANYPKVKIVRLTKREGLIRARLLGLNHSTAPVLTFLDSHCECTEGWLEPLLDRIAKNYTTVVSPFIDTIDEKTFEFKTLKGAKIIGGFNWRLEYDWYRASEREMKRHNNSAEPIHTPTIAGGLFSIYRKYFEHLGTYDEGFDHWGAENLELSFKTWMCGGTLEIVYCSHVGHVFRDNTPIEWPTGNTVHIQNSMRLADVWLDDYKYIFYKFLKNEHNITGSAKDVTVRKELRKRLGCKSFKWYLENVYPEQFVPAVMGAIGNIHANMCLEASDYKRKVEDVQLAECVGYGADQLWMIGKLNEIRQSYGCLTNIGGEVKLKPCDTIEGKPFWKWNPQTQRIENSLTFRCLAISPKRDRVVMEKCNLRSWRQKWHLHEQWQHDRVH